MENTLIAEASISISQNNNTTEKQKEHSVENWKSVLNKLKIVVETEKERMREN